MNFNFTIQKYSAIDFYNWESDIRKSISGLQDEIELHKYLAEQMKSFSSEQDFENKWTFFRLYTQYSWVLMTALDDNTPDILYGRQIPMAICLDFDILNKTIWYLRHNSAIESDMVGLYEKIKHIFSNSPAILGKNTDGQFVTVADYYKTIEQLNRIKASSIDWSEAKQKLATLLFPKDNEFISRFSYVESQDAVGEFFGIVNFLIGVKKENIWSVVDMYLNPELYKQDAKQKNVDSAVSEKPKDIVDSVATTTQPSPTKPSYLDLKKMIENKINYNINGQFKDINLVFEELSKLANQYNDPKISELYYFDEPSGQFKWNEELIKNNG